MQKLQKLERKHLFKDSVSNIIYFIGRIDGKYTKFSTGIKFDGSESSLKLAEKVTPRRMKTRELVQAATSVVGKKPLSHYFDLYIKQAIASNNSPSTITNKKVSVKHFKEYFDGYYPDDIVPSDEDNMINKTEWMRFVEYMQDKQPGRTMYGLTKHFRAICDAMFDMGVINKRLNIFNPNSKIENINRRKKRHRIYEPEEIVLMDMFCDDDQRLCLWMGYHMAFRLNDCLSLTWDRVDLTPGREYIYFRGDDNKAGSVSKVPISNKVVELLKARERKSYYVFPKVRDLSVHQESQDITFEKVIRESGINYGSHHLLRHTRLTEDFANPKLSDTMVMKVRRVSMKIALEHYIKPNDETLSVFKNENRV